MSPLGKPVSAHPPLPRAALPLLAFLSFLVCLASAPAFAGSVHHDIHVTLTPSEHTLSVVDAITLPKDSPAEARFALHAGLRPTTTSPLVQLNRESRQQGAVPLEVWRVTLPSGLRSFTLTYVGPIYHPGENDHETPGTISAEQVYLSGQSAWYPDFDNTLLTSNLEITLPAGWDAVSQGARGKIDKKGTLSTIRWSSSQPLESLYLIAARFSVTERADAVPGMVFLRAPDPELAAKYLDATSRYIDRYSAMLGRYPYPKFALVENTWESGYGMPSFTLLGQKVIHLPFIIDTSYPHEILHNWWGNGVFPDLATGNWSEGLTAYLADHLQKEERGEGVDYRVTTLQRYADYVRAGKDFPLRRFQSRHSPASEAIGYGKGMMLFHMLRSELGDELFLKGLREAYEKNLFRHTSYDDIRAAFESVAARDLGDFFRQWVEWEGAPTISLKKPRVKKVGASYRLTALLCQKKGDAPYHLRVPLAITLAGRPDAFQTFVDLTAFEQQFSIELPSKPLRIDLDPEYDLFRALARGEMPPALSLALGARKMLIILPSEAPEALLIAYRGLARELAQAGPDSVDVKLDSEVNELPRDRAVTVLGWENGFLPNLREDLVKYAYREQDGNVALGGMSRPRKDHSFAVVIRHPNSPDNAITFIASDRPDALPGLGRKLPHYHKYSYLAFEGAEPTNVIKGRWSAFNPSLSVMLPGASGHVGMAKLAARPALTAAEQTRR